ncbi:MAG: sirohydrochlorin chelatase, partial [Alphaproteobacteria bacterium]|nr:sirohydrochlorin chelatase [Alphaproteobacteria bacterium]
AVKLGFRRIIVFPYFLFTGRLVKRIYDHTDIVAARHPDVEFIKAPYLNDHPLVLDCFVDRVNEILDGQNLMNCALCKYREQVLGFESEVGLPQESHHHHVEGIGTDAAHSHGHGHDHRHDHAHHHHPYPHADHPLGPVTMEKLKEKEGGGE